VAEKKTVGQWIINVGAIVGAVLAIEGGITYLFKGSIDNYIKKTAESDRPSTRGDLSQEMEVRKELVVIELGKMYKEFKETQKNIETFNQTWIPYLESEKLFYYIGFFFDIEEEKVKYRDFDGDVLPCWHDEAGWYYMKQGFKYYK
jgi:hypothetical protein